MLHRILSSSIWTLIIGQKLLLPLMLFQCYSTTPLNTLQCRSNPDCFRLLMRKSIVCITFHGRYGSRRGLFQLFCSFPAAEKIICCQSACAECSNNPLPAICSLALLLMWLRARKNVTH